MTHQSLDFSGSDTVTRCVDFLRSAPPDRRSTLLAVCPISPVVVEANLVAAERCGSPAIFTATLNQVDTDGGYTGWTPEQFVQFALERRSQLASGTTVVFCLDHGGPWKKDAHLHEGLSFDQTSSRLHKSIEACIRAGYCWLHIDTSSDPSLLPGALRPERMAGRAAALMKFAEEVRSKTNAARIHYEVGVEEIGSFDGSGRLETFMSALASDSAPNVPAPSFLVCDLGTRLDGSTFDRRRTRDAVAIARAHNALIKAHYSDDLRNPEVFPESGIGAANVGPGLAARELEILRMAQESCSARGRDVAFVETLHNALDESGRWRKWLPDVAARTRLNDVPEPRRDWLLRTGARYVLQKRDVRDARMRLEETARECLGIDLGARVREYLADGLDRLYRAFNLTGFSRVIGNA